MPQARRSRLSLTRWDGCATHPFFWSPRRVACFSFLSSLSPCLQIFFIGGLTFYSQTVGNYIVFYTADKAAGTVSVARIMYGGRDIRRQLEDTVEW